MDTYRWLRIRSSDRSWTEDYRRFSQSINPEPAVWGAFYGLFGIGSNELLLVVNTREQGIESAVSEAGFQVVESHTLVPTVRPETFEPLSEPGLYVFRIFDVDNNDVEEITRLSSQAWTSFENSDRYNTRPEALFAPADRSTPSGVMVLVTWYDGLGSWQASRRSDPEAADNFRRRRELTKGTIAYATRLVGT